MVSDALHLLRARLLAREVAHQFIEAMAPSAADVEYALATRMEASKDIFMIPAARGHEYVRVSDRGMRTKLGIDATVPFAEKARF
ncbi:hypothetical protein B4Q13_17745, partial [Lacticaseibacillus rhamnosus]